MLRWAKTRSFFYGVHVHAGVIPERRLWLNAYAQSFVSTFASRASRHDATTGTHVQLSASKISRNHGNACVSESEVHRQSAHDASGDVTISVHNASREDVDVQFCNSDAKSYSVDALKFAACMPHAKTRSENGNVGGAESLASPNDEVVSASVSKFNNKCLHRDVSDASCETQSLHESLQTLFKQAQRVRQKASLELQQKIELLEPAQVSLSDATKLLKSRAFKSCSVEQLATALQELKKLFPCGKLLLNIVVWNPKVLLQPAELVQEKLKILRDFHVEEKVVNMLCGRGRVLSTSTESLQQKLMFYDNIGLTVEARNKMFSRGPIMLLFSIESIQPTLNFLGSIGLTQESILKLVQHCPELFYVSLDNMIKKYEYCRQLGFSVDEFPRIFRCVRRLSIKTIAKHLQFLKDFGFTHDDVCLMIKRQPAILAHASDSLERKAHFLIHDQNRDMAEIVQCPCCLMYSLEARMVPRFNIIKELGHSRIYSLSYILDATDSTFRKRFGK